MKDHPPDRELDNEPTDEDLRKAEREREDHARSLRGFRHSVKRRKIQMAPVDAAMVNLNAAENALRDAYGEEKAEDLTDPIWRCLEVLREDA